MWPLLRNLIVVACVVGGMSLNTAVQAQAPASVAFRNELNIPILAQGSFQVNGMVKRGQPVLVLPGKSAFEFNLPAGIRSYSIYDANQTSRVLVRDQAVTLLPGRDTFLAIRPGPGGRVVLTDGP